MNTRSTWSSMELRCTALSTPRGMPITVEMDEIGRIFDILRRRDGDTPTTRTGFAFYITGGDPLDGEIDVTYSNEVILRNDDHQGDAYTEMEVDFSGLFGGGLEGELAFLTDFDTLAVEGDLNPVPLPGGLPLLATGALLFGLGRRLKKR